MCTVHQITAVCVINVEEDLQCVCSLPAVTHVYHSVNTCGPVGAGRAVGSETEN